MSGFHFQGYAIHDTKKYTDFKLIDFKCGLQPLHKAFGADE